MTFLHWQVRAVLLTAVAGAALAAAGCGGRTMFDPPPAISVSLPNPTVVVSQDGMQVTVPIQINSTSETAVVMVTGLPGGVQVSYRASDTSPSGDLFFTGSTAAMAGAYLPTIAVSSAGAMANTQFQLVVTKGGT
jgi:hypothetical protein